MSDAAGHPITVTSDRHLRLGEQPLSTAIRQVELGAADDLDLEYQLNAMRVLVTDERDVWQW